MTRHPVSAPFIINLPASPVQDVENVDSYLPSFLHHYPSATIHYRWPGAERLGELNTPEAPSSRNEHATTTKDHPAQRRLRWPSPIHDALAGYDHLVRTFSPPPSGANGHSHHQRRDIYVVGSHLGGGLAAALALTESHANEPVAVRGLLSLNGVYNWTTFLPDHPINASRAALHDEALASGLTSSTLTEDDGQDLGAMRVILRKLFAQPADLFDPFASPVLFFHSAGIMVPPDFDKHWRPDDYYGAVTRDSDSPSSSSRSSRDDVYVYSDPEDPPPPPPFPETDSETDSEEDGSANTNADADTSSSDTPPAAAMAPPARRGYLAFPPRTSTLKIPSTLLLHGTPPRLPDVPLEVVGTRRRAALWRRLRNAENSFASQAAGLAGLMRRSVERLELRDRRRWDDESADWEGEATRRVEVEDVGDVEGIDLRCFGERGEDIARRWLEDHLGT